MPQTVDPQKIYGEQCSLLEDPERNGWCRGYVDQCIDQRVNGGMDPNESTFTLSSESGKTKSNMDFYECVQRAAVFVSNGKPKGYNNASTGSIAHYDSEVERMKPEIGKLGPLLSSRFTDALDAGLKCMPYRGGRTNNEKHCLAKNKYGMVKNLLDMAKKFYEKQVCRWKNVPNPRYNPHYYLSDRNHPKRGHGRIPPQSEARFTQLYKCDEPEINGIHYSTEYLLDFAKKYCTTSCVE